MGASTTTYCIIFTIVFLFLVVGLPLILVYTVRSPKDPTFSVESSAVKAFNLTSDNRLFCIINLGVRVRNPNSKYTFRFHGIDMEVRKGHHHKLADDALSDFYLGPGGGGLINVEAVGLHVGMERKIAAEVRADAAAGEGRVNVFMSGSVASYDLGWRARVWSLTFPGQRLGFRGRIVGLVSLLRTSILGPID